MYLCMILSVLRLVGSSIFYCFLLLVDKKKGKFTDANKAKELMEFKRIFQQRPDLCSHAIENYIKYHLNIIANGIQKFNPNIQAEVKIGQERREEYEGSLKKSKITKNIYQAWYIEVYLQLAIRTEILSVNDRNVRKSMMIKYTENALNHMKSLNFEESFPLYLADEFDNPLKNGYLNVPSAPPILISANTIPSAPMIPFDVNTFTDEPTTIPVATVVISDEDNLTSINNYSEGYEKGKNLYL